MACELRKALDEAVKALSDRIKGAKDRNAPGVKRLEKELGKVKNGLWKLEKVEKIESMLTNKSPAVVADRVFKVEMPEVEKKIENKKAPKTKSEGNSSIGLQPDSNSLLVPVIMPKGSKEVVGKYGFDPKTEAHITALGFPQGKELKRIFEDDPSKKAVVEKLIKEADFSYKVTDDFYRVERDLEQWVDWQDQSKGKKTVHEEAIIRLVDAPGFEKFINAVNKELGTNFPVPYPHISIGVKGTKFGIGIANKTAFDSMAKEKLDINKTTMAEPADDIKPRVMNMKQYGAALVKHIKESKNIAVKFDIGMAKKILSGESGAYATAFPKEGYIKYPDFKGVMDNDGALKNISKETGKSIQEIKEEAMEHYTSGFMEMTKVHEHIHMQAVEYMKENPKADETKYVNELYSKVRAFATKNPKHEVNQIQGGYWKENSDEFLAVALSNDAMIKFLAGVDLGMNKVEPKNSVLAELVKNLLSMLGMETNQSNVDGLLTTLLNMDNSLVPAEVDVDKELAARMADDNIAPWETIEEAKERMANKTTKEKPAEEAVAGLTDEQQVVYDGVYEFFSKSKDRTLVLDAAGGTGKTYTVGAAARMLAPKGIHVQYLAPTHAAKMVLEQSTGEEVLTIASALGFTLNEGTGEFIRDEKSVPKVGRGAYLAVDESSMITESMYAELLSAVGPKGKILFMGDRAQLPPIRSEADERMRDKTSTVSPALLGKEGKSFTLTKVMRFDGKSKIGALTELARNNSLKSTPEKVIDVLKKANFKAEGNVAIINNVQNAISSFASMYKQDAKGSVMVTYTNQLHPDIASVKSLNKAVREILHPDKMEEYVAGDVLVVYNTLSKDSDVVASNSERLEVKTASTPKIETISYTHKGKFKPTNVSFEAEIQRVTFTNGKTVKVFTPRGKADYLSKFDKLTAEAKGNKALWPEVYARKAATSQAVLDVEFGYAITSHKSQGQSFNNVMVMMDNITKYSWSDVSAQAASAYVGLSRPKKRLFIVSNQLQEGNTTLGSDISGGKANMRYTMADKAQIIKGARECK